MLQPAAVENKLIQWKMFKWIQVLLGIVLTVFLINWVSSPLVVTVMGTGEVKVAANNVTVSLSVVGMDTTPQGALTKLQNKVEVIRKILEPAVTSKADIVESQITTLPAAAISAGAIGYQASMTMVVETFNIKAVGDLVASLYSNGASVVSQPVLSATAQDELEQQAMDAAMADAGKQAKAIAKKHWKLIKKIVVVTQASSPTTSTVSSQSDTLNNQGGLIDNGVFKITKAVTISYKMW